MWTLQGVQALLDQQSKILLEVNSVLVNNQIDNTGGISIPRPKVGKRKDENPERQIETDNLKNFQKMIEEKLERRRKMIYDICEL